MSSSKTVFLYRDFEAGIYQSFQNGDSQFLVYMQSCWYCQPSTGICTLMYCPSPLLSGSTGGGGAWSSEPHTDKHLSQSPFPGQFFQMTTFCFGFCIVNQTLGFNHLGGKSLHGHEAELVGNILIPEHIYLKHTCITESDLICSRNHRSLTRE